MGYGRAHDAPGALQRSYVRIYYALLGELGESGRGAFRIRALPVDFSSVINSQAHHPPSTVITVALSREMFKFVCELVQLAQQPVTSDYPPLEIYQTRRLSR